MKIIRAARRMNAIPEGWHIVHDCDDDEGNWTVISKELPNNDGFAWIEDAGDNFEVTIAFYKPDGTLENNFPLVPYSPLNSLSKAIAFAESKIEDYYE